MKVMKRLMHTDTIDGSPAMPAFPQAQELEELALDIEKLAQFKQILSDMKKGYTILSGGYNTIKNLSQGNFNLHKGIPGWIAWPLAPP